MLTNVQQICIICYRSSLQYVNLKAPLVVQPEEDAITLKDKTYLECLTICSKLEFIYSKNRMESLCYDCAENLKRTYQFLQQVQRAHERMLLQSVDIVGVEQNTQLSMDTYSNKELDEEVDESKQLWEGNYDDYDDTTMEQCKSDLSACLKDLNSSADLNDTNDSYTTIQMDIDVLPMAQSAVNETDFMCNICDKIFSHLRNLKDHYRHTHKTKMFYCQFCKIFFKDAISQQNHAKSSHTKLVCCDKCDYESTEATMVRHKRNMHGNDKFVCTYCGAKYSCQRDLTLHLKYHLLKQKAVYCDICNKKFSMERSLQRHMKTHQAKREMFTCPQCNKKYIFKGSLDRHMRIHEGTAVKCKLCGKSCASFVEMKVHMRFHTLDYTEMCEICGKKFTTKGNLHSHMRQHENVKFKCNKCDKQFRSLKGFNYHTYVHSKKPFTCRFCNKIISSKQSLKKHLKSTHAVILTAEELQKNKTLIEKSTT